MSLRASVGFLDLQHPTLLGLGAALLLRGTAALLFLTLAAAGGLATWWGLRRDRDEAPGA